MEKAPPCVKAGLRRAVPNRYRSAMSDKDGERARRLAEALRENLKRRKAQAREKEAGEGVKPCSAEPAPEPSGRPRSRP